MTTSWDDDHLVGVSFIAVIIQSPFLESLAVDSLTVLNFIDHLEGHFAERTPGAEVSPLSDALVTEPVLALWQIAVDSSTDHG